MIRPQFQRLIYLTALLFQGTNPCSLPTRDPSDTCPTPPANCSGLTQAYFTDSYLNNVQDPIDEGETRSQNPCNSPGLSQVGAGRWARGSTLAKGTPTPWSGNVKWEHPEQILTHYYTGIDIRNSSGTVLTPPLRWNLLEEHDSADPDLAHGSFFTMTVQNTGVEAWNANDYSIWYTLCPSSTTCPDYSATYWMYWSENSSLAHDYPNESPVEPGESVTAYGYLYHEDAGDFTMYIDVCTTIGPGRANKRPGESQTQWRDRLLQLRKGQRVQRLEDTSWTCFGNQSPGWPAVTKVVNFE